MDTGGTASTTDQIFVFLGLGEGSHVTTMHDFAKERWASAPSPKILTGITFERFTFGSLAEQVA